MKYDVELLSNKHVYYFLGNKRLLIYGGIIPPNKGGTAIIEHARNYKIRYIVSTFNSEILQKNEITGG